ncbi:serine/threonine-protein kinase [Streptomyces griseoincarnatus]
MDTILADRYRLLELLGSGGMGEVWRAVDERLGRRVAVKVTARPEGSDGLLGLRLRREARAAARLNDPRIVTVHDHGEDVLAGRPVAYIVMELVDGQPLHRVVPAGAAVPVADVLEWGEQICEGLQAAHGAGVIHRDIKPSNLLLTAAPHRRIKICDFGIARSPEHSRALTGTGAAVGTPAYMSPEQIRGEKDIDARSDLYSLGCVLYELLAGTPPFTGTGWSLLGQHLDRKPEPLGVHRAGVPDELECLVGDLLSKEPQDRPATAADVARRLGSARARLRSPVPAGPAEAPTITAQAPDRRRVPAVQAPAATAVATRSGRRTATLQQSGPARFAWRAGVATGLLVAAQLALFTGLPALAQAALAALSGGLVAVCYTLESPETSASGAGPGEGDVALSAVALFTALLVAAGVLVLLLVWSPGPWWAALVGGTVAGPVLVYCTSAVRSLVGHVVRRGWLPSDLASTAGLVNGFVAALLAMGSGASPTGLLASGASVWLAAAFVVAALLPRHRPR